MDTHAILWWWGEPDLLSARARHLIAQPEHEIWASAASAWEVATKVRLGKLQQAQQASVHWCKWLAEDGFRSLAVTDGHALRAGLLVGEHRDPFDRMLAAQAMMENLLLITRDAAISDLGAPTVW